MKAIVYTAYGPPEVLQLKEVEKPAPGDDEVLVKTHAATVTAGDCEIRGFNLPMWLWLPVRIMMGLTRPRRTILGQELAGEIEAAGRNVQQFKAGDPVFAACFEFGAYAQYKCLPGDGPLAIKPANMSYAEAACIPTGGYNALHFLKKANIQAGQQVLINGAGGCIGVIAIQLARYFGAEVTGVDSAEKLDMLRGIGADHVIDYKQVDFTKSGKTYDVILDVIGKSPYSRSVRCLNKNGFYLLANPRFLRILRGLWTSATSSKKVIFEFASARREDLEYLRDLIEAGKIKAVIDRSYPLDQVAEAHTYMETGRKKGCVAITIEHDD